MDQTPLTKQKLSNRGVSTSTNQWLKQMSQRDTLLWGIENQLWVIDNQVYDLSSFAEVHPGGKSWIEMTRGQDISVLFVTHHLDHKKAKKILDKFYISEAKIKHKPRFQFSQHYQQIRARILRKYSVQYLHNMSKTTIFSISLITFWLLLITLAAYFGSFLISMIAGYFMTSFYAIGHLFIHRRDTNFLRNVFLLIGISAQQQQIMHAISHHPYCNTYLDYEHSSLEPIAFFSKQFLDKNRWYTAIVLQIVFILISPINIITKVLVVPFYHKEKISWKHLLCLFQIIYIYIFSGDLILSIELWFTMLCVFGFSFGKMPPCIHRQPQHWSENNKQIQDFVYHIISTTSDVNQSAVGLSSMIFYGGFNIHIVHHLFPTVDHSKLPQINEIFKNYCIEKGLKFLKNNSAWECNFNMWKLIRNQKEIKKFM